jgi:hypothetical protein
LRRLLFGICAIFSKISPVTYAKEGVLKCNSYNSIMLQNLSHCLAKV